MRKRFILRLNACRHGMTNTVFLSGSGIRKDVHETLGFVFNRTLVFSNTMLLQDQVPCRLYLKAVRICRCAFQSGAALIAGVWQGALSMRAIK